MKNISTIMLLYTIFSSQYLLTVAIDQVSKLENLNVLTLKPRGLSFANSKQDILTVDQVCTAIHKGQNAKNNDKYVKLEYYAPPLFELSTQIPSDYKGTIYINVSGYAGMLGNARYKYAGSGAYTTFNYLKAKLMPPNAICISFDGRVSDRAYFNFGQELDQDCLNTVYEETIQKNPHATIVLSGSCKGATTILNYLTNPNNMGKDNNFSHIKAVFLESPSISLERVTNQVANKYLYGFCRPLYHLFRLTFPNYKWNEKNMLDWATNLPSHIPILIGYLRQDKVANYEDILKIAQRFKQAGKNVEVFESQHQLLKHGHLSKDENFQKAVQNFLARSLNHAT